MWRASASRWRTGGACARPSRNSNGVSPTSPVSWALRDVGCGQPVGGAQRVARGRRGSAPAPPRSHRRRESLKDVSERLRIARESVATSQGFVREIDGEIAAKKALMAGTGAEGRLAASNAGLAILARDRRDLAARVADLVGIVLDAGKLAVVAGEIRRIAPEAARLVEACARSGLRREANPEETLRADGPLGGLLAGLADLPEIATPLERAAEDAALRARAQENEAQSRRPRPAPAVPRAGRACPRCRRLPRRTRAARHRRHADLRTRRDRRSDLGAGAGGPARSRTGSVGVEPDRSTPPSRISKRAGASSTAASWSRRPTPPAGAAGATTTAPLG